MLLLSFIYLFSYRLGKQDSTSNWKSGDCFSVASVIILPSEDSVQGKRNKTFSMPLRSRILSHLICMQRCFWIVSWIRGTLHLSSPNYRVSHGADEPGESRVLDGKHPVWNTKKKKMKCICCFKPVKWLVSCNHMLHRYWRGWEFQRVFDLCRLNPVEEVQTAETVETPSCGDKPSSWCIQYKLHVFNKWSIFISSSSDRFPKCWYISIMTQPCCK